MQAFKNTTALGTIVGAKFTEISAALGVMHDKGIQRATAGSALTTALINMTKPSDKVVKMMEELNVSFSAFDKNTGALKSLPDIFDDLAAATSKLTPKRFTDFMDELTGKRGIKATGALTDDVNDAMDKLTEFVGGNFVKLREYIKSFEDATGRGVKSITYLQEAIAAASESGAYQLDLLQANVEKLFVQSYDNASVVRMLKELNATVTDPSTVEALEKIVSLVVWLANVAAKAIVITVDVVTMKTASKNMSEEGFYSPEGGFIGGQSEVQIDSLSQYKRQAEIATEAVDKLKSSIEVMQKAERTVPSGQLSASGKFKKGRVCFRSLYQS